MSTPSSCYRSFQAQGAFLLILGDKQSELGEVHSQGVAGLTTPFPVLTGHLGLAPVNQKALETGKQGGAWRRLTTIRDMVPPANSAEGKGGKGPQWSGPNCRGQVHLHGRAFPQTPRRFNPVLPRLAVTCLEAMLTA